MLTSRAPEAPAAAGAFPTPYPLFTSYGAAIQAEKNGGEAEKKAVGALAKKVRQALGRLCGYVESVVRNLPLDQAPALVASVLMHISAVGTRKPKAPLEVDDEGAPSGTVYLIALAILSAVHYAWEWSQDGQNWLVGLTTGQAHATAAGLTPGKLYYFRVHALLRDGTMSTYTPTVELIVR